MAECGLLNLVSCLPGKIFEFILDLMNSMIQPLLDITQSLLAPDIKLELLVSLWAIIIYMLSMFYALLILYSGFNFMVSGHDVAKRENAKSWLRNIIIMIILVQASFFIYELVVDLSSVMSSASLGLIDTNFFLLTSENIVNSGLQFAFIFVYILVMMVTVIIQIVRYAIVLIGVVLLPIAIFFYFIPPLKAYGSFILNFLGIAIFINFFNIILLIGFSQIVNINLFANIKILVVIAAFLIIDILTILMMLFSVMKADSVVINKLSPIVVAVGKVV